MMQNIFIYLKKITKRSIAVLLCLSMIAGSTLSCFATEKKSYVSIGDSQSIAFGHTAYVNYYSNPGPTFKAKAGSYGYRMNVSTAYENILLKNYLNKGKDAYTWTQSGFAGTRPEEYLYFLNYDKYAKGEYLDSGVDAWVNSYQFANQAYALTHPGQTSDDPLSVISKEIKDSIKNADLLSIELGSNNAGAYLFYSFVYDGWNGSADLSNLLTEMGSKVNAYELKTKILNVLKKSGVDVDFFTSNSELVDGIVYGVLSFCKHFDDLMAEIYNLNSDVEVVVLGIMNPVDGVTVNYKGVTLPIGDLVEPIYKILNTYMQVLSKYSDRYYFVDVAEHKDEISTYYREVRDKQPAQYSDEIKNVIMQVFNDMGIDMTGLSLEYLCNTMHDAVNSCDVIALSALTPLDEESREIVQRYMNGEQLSNELKAKAINSINTYMFLLGSLNLGVHTTEAGHAVKAALIEETLRRKIPARKYFIENATGVITIRDQMYAAIEKLEAASEIIQNYKNGNTNVYEATKQMDDAIDSLLASVRKINPLLAASLDKVKADKNALIIMMAYMYENAGYSYYKRDAKSSYTAIVGSSVADGSYVSEAANKIFVSNPRAFSMEAGGTRNALQLGLAASEKGSDLYSIDLGIGDVKKGILSTKDLSILDQDYSSYLNECFELFKNTGLSLSNEAINSLNSVYKDIDVYNDVVLSEVEIASTIHGKDKDALVCYMGMRGASDEQTKALYDIANMSLFLSAMFSDNTIYVDCTESSASHVASQLAKHVTSTPEERLEKNYYADILKSVSSKVSSMPAATVMAMKDVKIGAWYEKAVTFCVKAEIMKGKLNGLFDPSSCATRAEVISMLYRLAGSPDVGNLPSFNDIKSGVWYEKAVIWAKSVGLSNGDHLGNFNPTALITRQDLITLLERYSEIVDKKTDAKDLADQATDAFSKYIDCDQIRGYAKSAMIWAVNNGIIKGNTKAQLNPLGYVTRAQLAQFFYNYIM